MSKKGQGSREQGAGSDYLRAGSRAEKEPRVGKPSQTAYIHDTSSQGLTQQKSPRPALPFSPRVRSGCPFQKPPVVPSARGRIWPSWAIRDSHCRIGPEKL